MKPWSFSFNAALVSGVFTLVAIPSLLGWFLQNVMEKVLVSISGNYLCVYSASGPQFYCQEIFQLLLLISVIIIISVCVGIACGFAYGKLKNR